MAWNTNSPESAIIIVSACLLALTLFSRHVRSKWHLSEPPIAMLLGIILGPKAFGILVPNLCGSTACDRQESWGWGDRQVEVYTRFVVGIQVFAVGASLPKQYAKAHWKSVAMLLLPVMAWGWIICAISCFVIFYGDIDIPTALIISACLTPTDPVLASSILENTPLSINVPKRLRDLLKTESGCNDGTAYPGLFFGLYWAVYRPVEAMEEWFLWTIVYQCVVGTFVGYSIGRISNELLHFSHKRHCMAAHGPLLFFFFLATIAIHVGSLWDMDEFLVAFGAGYGFARDGRFEETTKDSNFFHIIDDFLNNAMFLYMGTIIPWESFRNTDSVTPWITPSRLMMLLILVLLFRRLPILIALHHWIPDIHGPGEALFCGHFGPMGPGALFLAIEARARLETNTSSPFLAPPPYTQPYSPREKAILSIPPVVQFIVLGSAFVQGFSVPIMMWFHAHRQPCDPTPSKTGHPELVPVADSPV